MAVILNWLWQGSAVALAATLVLAVIRRSRAHDRYLAVWATLVSVLALPIVQYLSLSMPSPAVAAATPGGDGPLLEMPVAWWTSTTFVVLLWASWLAFSCWRLMRSAVVLWRVKRASSCLSPRRQDRLTHWASVRITGRAAQLVVCPGVRSAAVLGCGSPAIAIAPSLLEHLGDEELDCIVVHEWAHIQRRDDWAQLLQSCIKGVAGWHPAVWWLDRQLRIEREVACDELAVAITGSAKGYAASLVKLASLPAGHAVLVSEVAALGPSAGLGYRIARILSLDRRAASRTWRVAAGGIGVLSCIMGAALGGFRAIDVAAAIVEARMEATITQSEDMASSIPSHDASLIAPTGAVTTSGSIVSPSELRQPSSRGLAGADVLFVSPSSSGLSIAPRFDEITASQISGAIGAGAPRALTSGQSATHATAVVAWRAAADSGVAIGRESRDAAVATAGYFTRLGKRIAGSF